MCLISQGYCDFLTEEKLLEAVQVGQVVYCTYAALVNTWLLFIYSAERFLFHLCIIF